MEDRVIKIFQKHINDPVIEFEHINNGVTNQTYRIKTNKYIYILRIAGKGTNSYINRQDEIINMKIIASNLEILPPVYYSNEETGLIISKYVKNSHEFNKKDFYDQRKLSLLNETLINLHRSQIKLNNEFNIEKSIYEYQTLLQRMNCAYPQILQENLSVLEKSFKRLKNCYKKILVPCHNDPKMDNFLLTDKKIYLIDWEYSGMADEYFELANFTLTNELDENEEKYFLENYIKQSKMSFIDEKYILYKIVTDYLWIFWHLIKLNQNQNVEYNEKKWKGRLFRALKNIEYWEGKFK